MDIMNEDFVKISTFGSCVIRDTLRIGDKNERFKLNGNVGFISPMSMFSSITSDMKSIEAGIRESNVSEFAKRNIILDLKKSCFEYLQDYQSDYLLFDVADIRLQILQKGKERITLRGGQETEELAFLKKELKNQGFELSSVDIYSLEEIETCLNQFCKKISELYPPEKLIFVKSVPTNNILINGHKMQNIFLDEMYRKSDAWLIRYACSYVERNLKCNVIDMPEMQYVMADLNHTWGMQPFHYTRSVYEYLYAQLCRIVFGAEFYPEIYLCKEKIMKEYYRALVLQAKDKVLSDEVLDLVSTNNLIDYLAQIKKLDNCITIVNIKDTAGKQFDKKLQANLFKIGFTETLVNCFQVGYIAVIKNRVVIYEKINQEKGYEEYNGFIDYINLYVVSASRKAGNVSKILINGIDYSCNYRGLNIVTMDLKSQKVVDSVSFDTHEVDCTCRRRKDILSNEDMIRIDLRKIQHFR